jgi:uncharacterized protein YjbI with pentapeptide repeats
MSGLASDWEAGRQECVDVLCGYLRMPFETSTALSGEANVRDAILDAIRLHLAPSAGQRWMGCDFDFSGARFDRGSLDGSHFEGGKLKLAGCQFFGSGLSIRRAQFNKCLIDCSSISVTSAAGLDLSGSIFYMAHTIFSGFTIETGSLDLRETQWYAGNHVFDQIILDGGAITFDGARFRTSHRMGFDDRGNMLDPLMSFRNCQLKSGKLGFRGVEFEYEKEPPPRKGPEPLSDERHPPWPYVLSFTSSDLCGATLDFSDAEFIRGDVVFMKKMTASSVLFRGAEFRAGRASFRLSKLKDCLVDFTYATFWGDDELTDSKPFCQAWMTKIEEQMAAGYEVSFVALRYPIPSVDFTDAVLEQTRIEFESISAGGGLIDFKGATFDEADICFAHVDHGNTVIVLWNTDYRTRSGQLRMDEHTSLVILTNSHHVTHNKLKVISITSWENHDGEPVKMPDLHEVTAWVIGISGMD